MAATLAHRGPDDEGLWVDPDGRVAFGHRRLAVVDLSPHGHQPMASADGRWVVSYNGEIYNFAALRQRLAGEGMRFRGGSDTEVVVGAVQAWGIERTLDAIEGMFAIALWDRQRAELHLVRDRFGEKPLYYGWVGPSAGLRLGAEGVPCPARLRPDPRPGRRRLVPAAQLRARPEHRLLVGVAKLQPGRWSRSPRVPDPVRSRPAGCTGRRRRRSPGRGVRPGPVPTTAWSTGWRRSLADAVAARMVADVPVGAFLSGGVDSSVIVALMQRAGGRPVHTFSVGFADRAFDESVEAAAVAAHLGTDHTSLRVTDSDAATVIPRLPDIWDEPFADVSQIPMLLVSKLARTEVTVALSG